MSPAASSWLHAFLSYSALAGNIVTFRMTAAFVGKGWGSDSSGEANAVVLAYPAGSKSWPLDQHRAKGLLAQEWYDEEKKNRCPTVVPAAPQAPT